MFLLKGLFPCPSLFHSICSIHSPCVLPNSKGLVLVRRDCGRGTKMKCSQASLDRHIPAATPKPAGAIDQGVFLRLMAWKKFREFCFTWFSCCAKCVPSRFTCSRTASDLRSELVLSSWLPERSYHSSEPYSCGNAASFLKVMQVRDCIHQVWPFRLHFDTLSTENDVSEKHRVWKKHTNKHREEKLVHLHVPRLAPT